MFIYTSNKTGMRSLELELHNSPLNAFRRKGFKYKHLNDYINWRDRHLGYPSTVKKTSRRCTWGKNFSEFSPSLTTQRRLFQLSKQRDQIRLLQDESCTLEAQRLPPPWYNSECRPNPCSMVIPCSLQLWDIPPLQLTSCHPFLLAQWARANIDTRGILLGPG